MPIILRTEIACPHISKLPRLEALSQDSISHLTQRLCRRSGSVASIQGSLACLATPADMHDMPPDQIYPTLKIHDEEVHLQRFTAMERVSRA
jgi:hypothetical protein